jgi:TonB family protein
MTYFLYHFLSLLIFWAFYQVFLKKDTFFERNRSYLLVCSAIACVIPFLEITNSQFADFEQIPLPVKEVYVKLQDTNVEKPAPTTTEVLLHSPKLSTSQGIDKYEIVKFIYFLGVAISLILFGLRLVKLLLLIQRLAGTSSTDKVESKKIKVFLHGKISTFSFFNYLFWDSSQNLTKEEEKQILEHELAHIKGGHSYDLIFVELQKIVFWFNPLIYVYQKELINQHEFIADSRALKHSDTESYISLMVSSLFKSLQIDFTHSFHDQQIKQRIKMLEKKETSKLRGNLKSLFAVLIIGMIIIGFACTKGLEKIAQEQNLSKAEKALMKEYLAESEEFEKKYPKMEMKYTYKEETRYDSYYKFNYLVKNVIDIDIQGITDEKERERLKYILLELNKYWVRQEAARTEEHIAERKKWDAEFGTYAEPIESWESIKRQVPCFQEVDTEEVIGYNKWGSPIKRFFWSVQGVVNENGEVESVTLVEGTGNKECDEKFLKLVKAMKWKPSIKDGKAKRSSFGISMPFVTEKGFYQN